MKILVTGAEGFVGSNFIKKIHCKHEVIAVDYLNSRDVSNIPREVKYFNHDLSTPFFLTDDPDLLIHFAVISQEVVGNNPELESVNIRAMFNILELCRKGGIPLVFPSSVSIYGPGVRHKTSDPYDPKSLYAVGKIACEEYAKFYHHTYGLDVTILRYSNVYGDTTYVDNKFYVGKKDAVRIFMEKALADEPLPIIGGDQTRDFTFIDDVVEGTIKLMSLKGLSIINVATGVETSIRDLALMVGEALGKEVKLMQVPKRKVDNIPKRSIDPTGVSDLWKPKYSLKEGLKEYAKRMREMKE